MIIQEAIKTGKPFKRPHHDRWIENFRGHLFWGDSVIVEGKPYKVAFEMSFVKEKKKIKDVQVESHWQECNPGIDQPLVSAILTASAVLATDWEVKE